MRPETVLGGGALVVVVASAFGAVVLPGVAATAQAPANGSPANESPPTVEIRELTVAAGPTSGGTATLQVDTRLKHGGATAENVTLELRAVDRQSGMVETTRRVDVGNLTRDGERRVLVDVRVPRSGGYRIETLVYRGARRVDHASVEVGDVESLDPGRLEIREVSIAPGSATGATATLRVDTRLNHDRGPSREVTLELRAVDLESGLVETTRRIDVGDVVRDGERRVLANLTVPRSGGYRIVTLVYQGPRRVDRRTTTVRGVDGLKPAYADSGVGFHEFGDLGLPPVDYSIADVHGGRAELNVSAYVTNSGDRSADDLRLELIARQSESGIVADRTTVAVDDVRPGRTVRPAAKLTVPDGYNYYLDAVLRKDGVVVATARSAAVLSPNRSLAVNRSNREDGLKVGEFDDPENPGGGPGGGSSGDGGSTGDPPDDSAGGDAGDREPTPTETMTETRTEYDSGGEGGVRGGARADDDSSGNASAGGTGETAGGGGAGFGIAVALLALAAIGLLARGNDD